MQRRIKMALGLGLVTLSLGGYFAWSALHTGHRALPVARQKPLHAFGIGAAAHAVTTRVADGIALARQPKPRRAEPWGPQFRRAQDYLRFIEDAEGPAQRGDGRAAFYISKALLVCSPYIVQYRSASDPLVAFQTDQLSHANEPEWAQQVMAKNFDRCKGLIQGHPFSSLPARSGGYPPDYWFKQAIADGDRVAAMDQAASALASVYDSPPSTRTESIKGQLQSEVTGAVESADPHAMFLAGMMLANAKYSAQPLEGVAIALAACDLGYDCSASNPDNPFSMCAATGSCPADATFSYYVEQSLGADKYAEAYSEAQSIKDMLSRNDRIGIATVTQLR